MLDLVAGAEIHVRDAVSSDGVGIGEAHAAAWTAAYQHIFDADFLGTAAEGRRVGWPRSIDRVLTAPNILLVAEVTGRVMGFAHAMPAPETRRAEVRGFYCHPDAWGTGVAPQLMSRCLLAVRDDADEVFLWTFRDAERARGFYEKMGYRATGQTRDEGLTDWTTGDTVERPAVEYARTP